MHEASLGLSKEIINIAYLHVIFAGPDPACFQLAVRKRTRILFSSRYLCIFQGFSDVYQDVFLNDFTQKIVKIMSSSLN